MPATEPYLDRLRRRTTAAADEFADCHDVEVYAGDAVDWISSDAEWTIGVGPGEPPRCVRVALGDGKPLDLTVGEAVALSDALVLRAELALHAAKLG